jgi:hypothetical protein
MEDLEIDSENDGRRFQKANMGRKNPSWTASSRATFARHPGATATTDDDCFIVLLSPTGWS